MLIPYAQISSAQLRLAVTAMRLLVAACWLLAAAGWRRLSAQPVCLPYFVPDFHPRRWHPERLDSRAGWPAIPRDDFYDENLGRFLRRFFDGKTQQTFKQQLVRKIVGEIRREIVGEIRLENPGNCPGNCREIR